MINLHERMLPTLAGVESATSWSPVERASSWVTETGLKKKKKKKKKKVCYIQSNLNGSNIFWTMKICSRYGEFEPLRANYTARSVGKLRHFRDGFSIYYKIMVCWVYSLESPQWCLFDPLSNIKMSLKHSKIFVFLNDWNGLKNESATVNKPSVFEFFWSFSV